MEPQEVLRWEMHSADHTVVTFSAIVDRGAFTLILAREQTPILSGVAADAPALFRMSHDLRGRLQRAGFESRPSAVRSGPPRGGGICWGPGAPLPISLLLPLSEHGSGACVKHDAKDAFSWGEELREQTPSEVGDGRPIQEDTAIGTPV